MLYKSKHCSKKMFCLKAKNKKKIFQKNIHILKYQGEEKLQRKLILNILKYIKNGTQMDNIKVK